MTISFVLVELIYVLTCFSFVDCVCDVSVYTCACTYTDEIPSLWSEGCCNNADDVLLPDGLLLEMLLLTIRGVGPCYVMQGRKTQKIYVGVARIAANWTNMVNRILLVEWNW
jgi:hypothetical protein